MKTHLNDKLTRQTKKRAIGKEKRQPDITLNKIEPGMAKDCRKMYKTRMPNNTV